MSAISLLRILSIALVILIAVVPPADCSTTEESSSSASSASSAVKSVEKKTSLKIEKDKVLAGVFYGFIRNIHPEGLSVTIRETGARDRQIVFYLDKRTKYRLEKKRIAFEDLEVGDKVAIQIFGDDELLLADVVFVVPDEFEPDDYVAKKKKRH